MHSNYRVLRRSPHESPWEYVTGHVSREVAESVAASQRAHGFIARIEDDDLWVRIGDALGEVAKDHPTINLNLEAQS